ncbi:helix-turn-helix domain-containing protein [Corynebacterium sp. ES2715-CONJ3]|uniref:helix-turn-helix domain-containing protein n=1 Tax=Corynebacterium sp. ES2715-CONJ3 TaxID=2974028 RepID=UPI0037BFF068
MSRRRGFSMSGSVITFDPALDPWLTPRQASALLGFAPKTLANWRSAKIGPAFSSIGGSIRYGYSALVAFQDASPIEGSVAL